MRNLLCCHEPSMLLLRLVIAYNLKIYMDIKMTKFDLSMFTIQNIITIRTSWSFHAPTC